MNKDNMFNLTYHYLTPPRDLNISTLKPGAWVKFACGGKSRVMSIRDRGPSDFPYIVTFAGMHLMPTLYNKHGKTSFTTSVVGPLDIVEYGNS
jgi:hypothetical protein